MAIPVIARNTKATINAHTLKSFIICSSFLFAGLPVLPQPASLGKKRLLDAQSGMSDPPPHNTFYE
jgi:hypothetical protein